MAVSQSSTVVVAPMPPEGRGKNSKGRDAEEEKEREEKTNDVQFDIWGSIQTLNKADPTTNSATPAYVHPLVRRSKNSMSPKSLEICTEKLGSETGSDGFSDLDDYLSSEDDLERELEQVNEGEELEAKEEGYNHDDVDVGGRTRKELAAVNYHCSIGRRSLVRSFPPPLPSISRRDGPCVQMRRHWRDGRLVVEAVPVPSQNYLHWQREGGRLVLSFIESTAFEEIYPCDHTEATTTTSSSTQSGQDDVEHEVVVEEQEMDEEEEEEDEEGVGVCGDEDGEECEEVEVVDRGNVVEVKLLKGHRPSLVINKFVGSAPLSCPNETNKYCGSSSGGGSSTVILKKEKNKKDDEILRVAKTGLDLDGWGRSGERGGSRSQSELSSQHHESKVLLTFKRLLMNRQALLHQVRSCSYQHGSLFIWEPCCCVAST